MPFWRMKLRNGFAAHGGEDMWPACRANSVAAITYNGIAEVDLHGYSRTHHPPGWDQVGGGKGSISHFAWDIRGGDAIYAADSDSRMIVGAGFARAKIGELAYRFDSATPIEPKNAQRWCHLIDVDWDLTFVPFHYANPRAPLITVLELNHDEIHEFERSSHIQGHRNQTVGEEEIESLLLLENQYPRYTPAALRVIRREHAALSNAFRLWLQSTHNILAKQEKQQIDLGFQAKGKRYLTEFKIAYHGNTKRAIREALGQILEYNHYPPRKTSDTWLLVMDTFPTDEDRQYLDTLVSAYHFPLALGWRASSGFVFSSEVSFS